MSSVWKCNSCGLNNSRDRCQACFVEKPPNTDYSVNEQPSLPIANNKTQWKHTKCTILSRSRIDPFPSTPIHINDQEIIFVNNYSLMIFDSIKDEMKVFDSHGNNHGIVIDKKRNFLYCLLYEALGEFSYEGKKINIGVYDIKLNTWNKDNNFLLYSGGRIGATLAVTDHKLHIIFTDDTEYDNKHYEYDLDKHEWTLIYEFEKDTRISLPHYGNLIHLEKTQELWYLGGWCYDFGHCVSSGFARYSNKDIQIYSINDKIWKTLKFELDKNTSLFGPAFGRPVCTKDEKYIITFGGLEYKEDPDDVQYTDDIFVIDTESSIVYLSPIKCPKKDVFNACLTDEITYEQCALLIHGFTHNQLSTDIINMIISYYSTECVHLLRYDEHWKIDLMKIIAPIVSY